MLWARRKLAVEDTSFLIYPEAVTGRQVLKRLQDQGWVVDRIVGSHHILTKEGKICPVPVHGSKDLKKGTLKNIERITGVKLK